jgi:hypothetical protein
MRSVKHFAEDESSVQARIVGSIGAFAHLNSMPSVSELSRSERPDHVVGVVCALVKIRGVPLGSFSGTVIGPNGIESALRLPLKSLCLLRALSIFIITLHSIYIVYGMSAIFTATSMAFVCAFALVFLSYNPARRPASIMAPLLLGSISSCWFSRVAATTGSHLLLSLSLTPMTFSYHRLNASSAGGACCLVHAVFPWGFSAQAEGITRVDFLAVRPFNPCKKLGRLVLALC